MVGGRIYSLLRDLLALVKPLSRTFGKLAETLTDHFEPKLLVIAGRFYFHSQHSQKAGESIAEFGAELRRLAAHCEFRNYLNEALRDRFVCELLHGGIHCRLLFEASLILVLRC